MNNWQRNLMVAGVSFVIIVVAFLLLSFGRKNEVAPILFFGYVLDALVIAGIVGNLVTFLLRLTSLNPIRTALWTLLTVNGVLLILALMIGSRVDANFRTGSVLIAYVASFLFWFGLHWVSLKGNHGAAVGS